MIPHNPLAQHDSLSQMVFAAENQSWAWTRDTFSRALARRELELALGLVPDFSGTVEETPAASEPDIHGPTNPHPLFCERELISVHAEDAWRAEETEVDGDDDADTQSPVETDDEDEADLRDDEDVS